MVIAGSPRRLFRLTAAGAAVAARLESSARFEPSPLIDRLLDAGAVHPVPDTPDTFGLDDVTVITPQLGGSVVIDGRITVDDASMPPLVDASIRLAENRGPAGARNAGRSLVSTPLVAFVDADVDLPYAPNDRGAAALGWWRPLLAQFDDESVGLVAPRVVGDPGSSLDLGNEPARIRWGTRVSYVPAAMVIVRTAAFDDVGGFDEALRFGEDVDFVWRLDDAGWRCRYDPRRAVHHRPRHTLSERLRQQVGYGSASAPLALRHPHRLAPFRSGGRVAAAAVLAAMGRPFAALGVSGWNVMTSLRSLPDVPPMSAVRLVVDAHLGALEHGWRAVRRHWWPIAVVAALVSRRARRIVTTAVIADPGSLLRDLAFGWGVWRGMLRHRSLRPITPDLTRRR